MMTESMEMCWIDKTLWEEMQQVMKSERRMERQKLLSNEQKEEGGESEQAEGQERC